MKNQTYDLPKVKFVGGETINLRFNLTTTHGYSFDAADCTTALAIVEFNNPNGRPIFELDGSITADPSGVNSVVAFEIPSNKTIHLSGRYIYQITIKTANGKHSIPGQGYMDITKNIHPDFIS